jgi:hypothetical protein
VKGKRSEEKKDWTQNEGFTTLLIPVGYREEP